MSFYGKVLYMLMHQHVIHMDYKFFKFESWSFSITPLIAPLAIEFTINNRSLKLLVYLSGACVFKQFSG